MRRQPLLIHCYAPDKRSKAVQPDNAYSALSSVCKVPR